jgi:hypothetical protein
MRQYQIPTNPANDTWVKAYATEFPEAMATIHTINDLGYLTLRSYSPNTIRIYPNTILDTLTSYREIHSFIADAVSAAYNSNGVLKVRCYNDRYCDVDIHIGQVSIRDEHNPVFTIALGQLYFSKVDSATIDEDDQFDPVEALYSLLLRYADSDESMQYLHTRWSNAVSDVS